MSADDTRSRAARERAERALGALALAFGEHAKDIIVIGGLNPDFLAPQAPIPHQGTTDVDVLLEVACVFDRDDQDFAWLDAALSGTGFTARGNGGWQWSKRIEEHTVQIDILCDVPDNLDQPIALPGSEEVTAKNLVGPSGAFHAPVSRELVVARDDGTEVTVELRFASLGGYLLAKSSALVTRQLGKDAYDLMYVTLFCPGGPAAAADAILDALADPPSGHDRRADIVTAMRSYLDRTNASHFAAAMQDSGDDSSTDELVFEARAAARAVLERLTK
ncbi:hypothetical protein [Leifsonia aquatica]|uniref:hypothetical protein n=1 Tax=Leifsonia aquatica TaxID=144185 RepID=UPI0028B1A5FD|nr:hypothetical protein [Leifsonia aquatica]